jgi:predicted ester cyclase
MAEDLKAIARRTTEEIFPNGDAVALAAVVHHDVVNHEAPPGVPQGLDGMTQTMLWLARAFSNRRYEIHQVVGEGDTVVVHCTFHGRHTGEFMGLAPTGRSFASRQIHIIRFLGGKGIEHWAVRDDLAMLRQLGALPNPASRPVPAGA